MDEMESDEALRFYQFLNYLDGGSFGTGKIILLSVIRPNIDFVLNYFVILGPIDEFVDAMNRLSNTMKQLNSRETQARGLRELTAINGEKGNSIKTVLEISTVIVRKKRKFFCTGEVKEPIVNNKIICKVRTSQKSIIKFCNDKVRTIKLF